MDTTASMQWPTYQNLDPADADHESAMRTRFIRRAEEVLAKISDGAFNLSGKDRVFGVEVEVPLVDCTTLQPVPQAVRDELVEQQLGDIEIGAHQLELTPPVPFPFTPDGVIAFAHWLHSQWHRVNTALQSHHAMIMPLGSIGWVPIEELTYTQGYDKYHRSPAWHQRHANPIQPTYGSVEPVQADNAYWVTCFNSIQVTLDARTDKEAVELVNWSNSLSPLLTALAANAGWLDHRCVCLGDLRVPVWQISHDARPTSERSSTAPRVGLPNHHITSIPDYLADIVRYPFVLNHEGSLEHAWEIGNGMCWRESRLKVFEQSQRLAVEFRPLSLQPTIEENINLVLLYLGLANWGLHNHAEPTNVPQLHAQKREAEAYGLYGNIAWGNQAKRIEAWENVPRLIACARSGLELAGIDWPDLQSFGTLRSEHLHPTARLHTQLYQCARPDSTRHFSSWMREACATLRWI